MIAEKKAAAGIGRAAVAAAPAANPAAVTQHVLLPPPRPMFPTGGHIGGTAPVMPALPPPEEEPDLPIPSGRSKLINAEEQVLVVILVVTVDHEYSQGQRGP